MVTFMVQGTSRAIFTDLPATKATHSLGKMLYTATRQGDGMAVFLFVSKVIIDNFKALLTLNLAEFLVFRNYRYVS